MTHIFIVETPLLVDFHCLFGLVGVRSPARAPCTCLHLPALAWSGSSGSKKMRTGTGQVQGKCTPAGFWLVWHWPVGAQLEPDGT